MEFVAVIVIAAAMFGLCYLADKGFAKLFRSRTQHKSGLAVRLSKRYGSIGLVLAVLGLAAVFMGLNSKDGWALPVCGGLLIVTGVCLAVYYLTFGVFYDENGFLVTKFGKTSTAYTYKDIQNQQLYIVHGQTIIELHLTDGKAVQLQSNMEGVYPFMDYAFDRWCALTGRTRESCGFYDPDNSCWFPPMED